MSAQQKTSSGAPRHYISALIAALLMAGLCVALSLLSFEDVAIHDAIPIRGDDDPWSRRMLLPVELAERLPPGASMKARPHAKGAFTACRPMAVAEGVSRADVPAGSAVLKVRLEWRSEQQRRTCLELAGASFAVAVPAGRRTYASLLHHAFLRD
jgi:hypothetical protein